MIQHLPQAHRPTDRTQTAATTCRLIHFTPMLKFCLQDCEIISKNDEAVNAAQTRDEGRAKARQLRGSGTQSPSFAALRCARGALLVRTTGRQQAHPN